MPFCDVSRYPTEIPLFQQRQATAPRSSFVRDAAMEVGTPTGWVDPSACVAAELALVERALAGSIRSVEPALTEIAAHLICGGGKRVRPMVTLLAYKAFGGAKTDDIVDIATAVELIHTATLLHDDIIDGAETRRGKESAYKKFGLKNTLVTGDFLFIKAFEFAGKFDDTIVQWTADACTQLTEGEVLQGSFNRNVGVTVADYIEIVRRKTASLFETGAKIGAYLAGGGPALVEITRDYGLNLGIAFQIVDDILDVVGHKELLGKPTGIDLRDGNPSLPIILALNGRDKAVAEAFQSGHPTDEKIREALEAMSQGTAIEQAKKLSRTYADQTLAAVAQLPPSVYSNGLRSLIELIIDRDF